MGQIMESLFCIFYLIVTFRFGILLLKNSKDDKQRKLFAITTLTLVIGDSFHLIPRIYGLMTGKIDEIYAALGFGTLVTSITMTIFYSLLYVYWCKRYNKEIKSNLGIVIFTLAFIRIALCLFPQNMWFSENSPVTWGIYRNIPFVILGIIMVAIFAKESLKNKNDNFRFASFAIFFSFLFYMPVVLFAGTYPIVGMMMLPKTICYIWLISMGYKEHK